MRAHTILRASALCLLLLSGAAPGHAQELASSLEQLRVLVRPGDNVRVTDTNGREMEAKVDRLSASSISLLVDGQAQTLEEGDILSIRQRKEDRLSNGARNGFISGAAFGLLVGLSVQAYAGGNAGLVAAAAIGYGAIGAGIGVGIDAMITRDRIIYDGRARTSPPRVSVAPFVTPERKGVAVSLGFK
jgi:outer membrane lipoprotein SlyB